MWPTLNKVSQGEKPGLINAFLSGTIFHTVYSVMKPQLIWRDVPGKSIQTHPHLWVWIYSSVHVLIFRANWKRSKTWTSSARERIFSELVKWTVRGQVRGEWCTYLLTNSPWRVRCYLTDPTPLIQRSDFPACPFPEKREWVRQPQLVAKTLFHHQDCLCDWTGQD